MCRLGFLEKQKFKNILQSYPSSNGSGKYDTSNANVSFSDGVFHDFGKGIRRDTYIYIPICKYKYVCRYIFLRVYIYIFIILIYIYIYCSKIYIYIVIYQSQILERPNLSAANAMWLRCWWKCCNVCITSERMSHSKDCHLDNSQSQIQSTTTSHGLSALPSSTTCSVGFPIELLKPLKKSRQGPWSLRPNFGWNLIHLGLHLPGFW